MPEYFERYGLSANPFALRVLDPLSSTDDDQHLLRDIDGFTQLSAVKEYLRERIGSPGAPIRPAFVLIAGSEKSGLSTAANAVLMLYRDMRNLGNRFAAVFVEALGHSELRLYRRWAAALPNRLQPLKLQLNPEVAKRVQDASRFSDMDTLEYELQGVLVALGPALDAKPGSPVGFGSCLEKIKTSRAVEMALVVFEGSPTVCVFTVQTTANIDVDEFAEQHREIHVLRLKHLNSQDVPKILQKKWGTASEIPLHLPTLGTFCEKQKHTVGVVLRLAERLLRKRVLAYEGLNRAGSWPEDRELGLTDLHTLELLEVLVNGGS